MYALFKTKKITHYYHAYCSFKKMRKARIESNVVKSYNELDGFQCIGADDKSKIIELIEETVKNFEEFWIYVIYT